MIKFLLLYIYRDLLYRNFVARLSRDSKKISRFHVMREREKKKKEKENKIETNRIKMRGDGLGIR